MSLQLQQAAETAASLLLFSFGFPPLPGPLTPLETGGLRSLPLRSLPPAHWQRPALPQSL